MSGKTAVTARSINWSTLEKGLNKQRPKDFEVSAKNTTSGVELKVQAYPFLIKEYVIKPSRNGGLDIETKPTYRYWGSATGQQYGLDQEVDAIKYLRIGGPRSVYLTDRDLKGLRETTLPKLIMSKLDETFGKVIRVIRKDLPDKLKANLISNGLGGLEIKGWTKDGYGSNYQKSIMVGKKEIGLYLAYFSSEGRNVRLALELISYDDRLQATKIVETANMARARTKEDVRKAAGRLLSKALKALKPLVDKALKSVGSEEMNKKKWIDAVKKRAKTAFRGAKPLVVNDNRVEFVVFEYKDRGKALYFVSFGMRKMQFGKTFKGQVFARLGTYKENVEKYLKVSLDDDTMADYFLEEETLYSKIEEFRLMADITKTFKALSPKLKDGIKQAKVEGKEATPETAAFIQRKDRKVSDKQRERQRREEREWAYRNISVYDDETPSGVTVWSAVSHDQGYAERVVEGFDSVEEAKDYIVNMGGGSDWVVVHGTQIDGKRLGRVEESWGD